jgi:hypothetical protein
MTEEQIARTAAFYGVDADEARRRYEVCQAHTGDPEDPICIGCARRPAEMPELDEYIRESLEDLDANPVTAEERLAFVLREEGTLNPENGHFLCNDCYIRNGQPSKRWPDRWVCP